MARCRWVSGTSLRIQAPARIMREKSARDVTLDDFDGDIIFYKTTLRMRVWIFGCQALRRSGRKEISIRCNERQGRQTGSEILSVDDQGRRKLGSVIATQAMLLS